VAPPSAGAPIVDGRSPFKVSQIGHRFLDTTSSVAKEGTCHPAVPAEWTERATGVGYMEFVTGSSLATCTGTLLANQGSDFAPLFLTANHCISTAAEAQSLSVYWNYDSPGLAGRPRSDFANLLSTGDAVASSDYSLLMLLGSIPASASTWAGWTTAMPGLATDLVGIHHPDWSYKRIAYGDIWAGITCPGGMTCGNFLRVNWNDTGGGATEGGSSGSTAGTRRVATWESARTTSTAGST
jgi:lysyl endopeptidase